MAKKKQSQQTRDTKDSSLSILISELKKESKTSDTLVISTNDILTNIATNIADMSRHILKMPILVTTRSTNPGGKDLEKEAEARKAQEAEVKRDETIKGVLESSLKELKELRKGMKAGGILDMILLGGALLSGFVTGLVTKIIGFFKPIMSLFESAGKGVGTLLASLKVGWTGFVGILSDIGKFFTNNKFIEGTINFFKSSWTKFVNMFSELSLTISNIGKMIGEVFSSSKGISGMFSSFVKAFEGLFGTLKIFFSAGINLGKRLLIPLQVVLSIFDMVSGAVDGWAKEEGSFGKKFFNAFEGGLTGLLNGLIGGLLDLLKNGISWIAGILGWENASKALDGFSFTDLITRGINAIFGFS